MLRPAIGMFHNDGRWGGSIRWAACACAMAASMAVPLAQPAVADLIGIRSSYGYGTIALLLAGVLVIRWWPEPDAAADEARGPAWLVWCAGGLFAAGLAMAVASALLPAVFAGSLDPYRADMLPVIDAGARRFLAGGNPYSIYEQIDWHPTLPYGPPMWLPFVLPVAARTDVRILTLIGYLTTVAGCGLAALSSAAARRWEPALTVAGLAIVLALHPSIHEFYPIAHSPVYWPLLLVFCGLLRAGRWRAAATALGLLVSTRTPMAALVPVFLMAAYHQHRLTRGVMACLSAAALGPFVPFLLVDAGALRYSLIGSYKHTVKEFVWRTNGIFTTYGTTAYLVGHKLQAVVEVGQLVAMAAVYALAWRALAARANPAPWLALALLVFSMTTLWPVLYLFFDVWVLMICALAVESVPATIIRPATIAGTGLAMAACVTGGVLAAAAVRPGATYTIDVGTREAAGLTGGGFGQDESVREGDRTFVWVQGTTARIRLPRAGWGPATIRVQVAPFESEPGLRQRMTGLLNDRGIGSTVLQPGWQDVSFRAAGRAWAFGFNVLDLHFSYAMPRPSDHRALSVAVDRVSIE